MTISKTSHLKTNSKVNNTEALAARKSDGDTTALTQGKDCEPYQTCFSELILDMNSMMKRSTVKPPFGVGQQLAMPPHTGLTAKNRGKRKFLGTLCRQLKSAPWEEARTKPDEPTSGVDLIKIQGSFGNDGGMSDMSPLTPVPYFKFWNSSLPPKSSGGLKRSSSEIALQHLAEIVLAGEQDSQDRGLAEATNKILQQRRSLKDNDAPASGLLRSLVIESIRRAKSDIWSGGDKQKQGNQPESSPQQANQQNSTPTPPDHYLQGQRVRGRKPNRFTKYGSQSLESYLPQLESHQDQHW
ncbi:uncharacterized protein LOC131938710 isoform X2 [Physella acuta]|uniref:uncharacterized protein LOC131938710 isoform X2 n=1 Tax=Physella acuta TaxID=109671 RepID=UPI0027DD265E|nr:uncharacterized protein LOC131938710 isoform X2 [Physella acuta]